MSWVQAVIVVVSFFVLYRFVIPFLFPTVVAKERSVNVRVGPNGEELRVPTGGMPMMATAHHSHATAVRRRVATAAKESSAI
jgi:hypothetical protein